VTEGVRKRFHDLAQKNDWGNDWDAIVQSVQKNFLANPTGQYGNPEDVGHLVAFLASPIAGYINSVNYRIDGGSILTLN
jgi:3-oxoacyl-[acyl-carrier protein] reductase